MAKKQKLITIDQLKEAIKTTGLKKNFIAKKCGMHATELSHILNGSRSNFKHVARLIAFLAL